MTDTDIEQLELMDWKEIESGAETAIRQSRKDIAIAKILLGNAQIRIKQLKGKTNAELDQEAKNYAKKQKINTTQ